MEQLSDKYWEQRYVENLTGWDVGHISTPLKEYFDQLTDKKIKILIPGAGNAYEAEYLHGLGFSNVFVVDWAQQPLDNLKKRVPAFPDEHLLKSDFFTVQGPFDLVVEQTFFCAIDPALREKYAEKMASLLNQGGKLVGLFFNIPLNTEHPPFGGCKEEYESVFSRYFDIKVLETAYNSIEPRSGNELFAIFTRK
jgi:methyl halide transferase